MRRRTRAYRGDKLILATRFETETGAVELLDFMPIRGEEPDVVRIVVGLSGRVAMRSTLRLRFDYGRLLPWLRVSKAETHLVSGPHTCRLKAPVPVREEDDALTADFEVVEGDRLDFVLTHYSSHRDPPAEVEPELALAETERFWSDWTGRCTYTGPWREAVVRSLVTMKALVHLPTGGIVAAPTAGLPEIPGGTANWDYRFCWLRDATFTLTAFTTAGYAEEGEAWRDWLLRAVAGHPAQIQPVYGVEANPRLTEWEAGWLAGFGGATPVRFGNLAFRQNQLDVFGEVMDALHVARVQGAHPPPDAWVLQRRIVEHVARIWRDPDDGIWETRDGPKQFTFSKVMAWVAVDRAIKSSEMFGLEAPREAWEALAAQMHAAICAEGVRSGHFVREFGGRELDASLLLLSQLGFVPPADPRMRATVVAIGERLTVDGCVYRSDPHARGAKDGSFVVCGFWLVDALVLEGRHEQAAALFERLLGMRNDLGLLAEEYDPHTRSLRGNFPQALSHLGLVGSAYNLATGGDQARRRAGGGQAPPARNSACTRTHGLI